MECHQSGLVLTLRTYFEVPYNRLFLHFQIPSHSYQKLKHFLEVGVGSFVGVAKQNSPQPGLMFNKKKGLSLAYSLEVNLFTASDYLRYLCLIYI